MFTASNQYIKSSLTGRRRDAGIPGPILGKSVQTGGWTHLIRGAVRWSHQCLSSRSAACRHRCDLRPRRSHLTTIKPPAPNPATCVSHFHMRAGQQSTGLTKSTKDYILCSINTLFHTWERRTANGRRWTCINRKATLVHSHRDQESKSRKRTISHQRGGNGKSLGRKRHANLRNQVTYLHLPKVRIQRAKVGHSVLFSEHRQM